MRRKLIGAALGGVVAVGALTLAQGTRLLSPPGSAATQVGGKWYQDGSDGMFYAGGKWIEVTYGRPVKRGRELFGSGANYGRRLSAGAPVWRAGANVSTRLKTEVMLLMGDKTVAPGEYSLFIDLKVDQWTLIVSTWAAQTEYDPNNKDALWGAFRYTRTKDVVRVPMTLGTLPFSVDQLTWGFLDITDTDGKLAIMWDKAIATVGFRMGM